jgi:hypothetical protein
VQVGQLTALGTIRVEVGAHGQQPTGFRVAELLEARMLLRGDGGHVRLDVGVDALVDEGHPGCASGEPERRSIDDAGVHGGAPFDAQAEPELWLCAQGTAVAAYVAGRGAVHRAEGTSERLRGSVAVPYGDAEQVVLTADDLGRGDRHASPADVLRQRHAGQRREHPAQVVLGRADLSRELGEVQLLGEGLLHEVDEVVERCDHVAPFHRQA